MNIFCFLILLAVYFFVLVFGFIMGRAYQYNSDMERERSE